MRPAFCRKPKGHQLLGVPHLETHLVFLYVNATWFARTEEQEPDEATVRRGIYQTQGGSLQKLKFHFAGPYVATTFDREPPQK